MTKGRKITFDEQLELKYIRYEIPNLSLFFNTVVDNMEALFLIKKLFYT